MKGLEGVSDSDFHGWTVPRYGADAKESGGADVANLAVRGPRNIYIHIYAGEGKDGTDNYTLFVRTFILTALPESEEVRGDAHIHETRGGSTWSHGSYHALGSPILRSPGAE